MRTLYQTVQGRIPQSYEAIKLKIEGRQNIKLNNEAEQISMGKEADWKDWNIIT